MLSLQARVNLRAYSPKFQHYWSLTIDCLMSHPIQLLMMVVVVGILTFFRYAVGVFYSPSRLSCSIGEWCNGGTQNCRTKLKFKSKVFAFTSYNGRWERHRCTSLPFIIIIILSCHHYGYPWPFLATSPYRISLSAGPQGYTPYSHWAAVCRLELVALLLLGHVKGSLGVNQLWAHPFFSCSVLHVWFV